MIFGVTIVIVLECHELHAYKTVNLINVVCILWLFHRLATLPSLSLSSVLPDTMILKSGQLIALKCPVSVYVKVRVTYLSLKKFLFLHLFIFERQRETKHKQGEGQRGRHRI